MSDEIKQFVSPEERFANEVGQILNELKAMLIAKNRKYGDAALNPKRTFARSSAVELINVRLDDKLSRIANRQSDDDEDPEWDMLGYLVLKRIAKAREEVSQKAFIAPLKDSPHVIVNAHQECIRGCTGRYPGKCMKAGCEKQSMPSRVP